MWKLLNGSTTFFFKNIHRNKTFKTYRFNCSCFVTGLHNSCKGFKLKVKTTLLPWKRFHWFHLYITIASMEICTNVFAEIICICPKKWTALISKSIAQGKLWSLRNRKCPRTIQAYLEAIVFTTCIFQIFLATHTVLKIGEYRYVIRRFVV